MLKFCIARILIFSILKFLQSIIHDFDKNSLVLIYYEMELLILLK